VRDHAGPVESAQARFHPVKERRKQLFVVPGLRIGRLHVTTFNPCVGCVTRDLNKSLVLFRGRFLLLRHTRREVV
jgi:hypothetical protein